MSNVSSINPNASTAMADMLANAQELIGATAVASQNFGKASKQVGSSEAPEAQSPIVVTSPSLSKPNINASSMIIALMALQTKASNESVSIGLESSENKQMKVNEQNQKILDSSVGYYDMMRMQEDVNGAMAVANVVIAGIFLVAALAMTICSAGAGAPMLIASVAACVGAAASVCSAVISLPAVQENISEKGAKIANIILTTISIAAAVIGCVSGIGALKSGITVAANASKAASVVNNVAMATTGLTSAASGTMAITSSSVNYKAAKVSTEMDNLNAELEELNSEFDTGISELNFIMESYSSMVESTAQMLQRTLEGSKSAATIPA